MTKTVWVATLLFKHAGVLIDGKVAVLPISLGNEEQLVGMFPVCATKEIALDLVDGNEDCIMAVEIEK